MTIKDAFDLYINEELYFQHRSQSVQQHYRYYRNNIVGFFGKKEIEDLTLADIREWEEFLFRGRCQNTVRSYVSGLKQVLRFCSFRGIKCLEASLLAIPQRIPVTVSYVTAEEVQELIDCAISPRTKFMISLLYASGVRLSEMLSLNRNSIRDRQFTVVGKGKKERLCLIDSRTERLMTEYLATREDSNEPMFISGLTGERLSPSTVQLLVRTTVKRSNISGKKISPHTFRHGYATNMIKNGAGIRYVAQALGHANLSTTMIYTHVEDPDLREKYEKYHTI